MPSYSVPRNSKNTDAGVKNTLWGCATWRPGPTEDEFIGGTTISGRARRVSQGLGTRGFQFLCVPHGSGEAPPGWMDLSPQGPFPRTVPFQLSSLQAFC